jgi:hypothetical protein
MANWWRLDKRNSIAQSDPPAEPQVIRVSLPAVAQRMGGSYARELRALGQTLERFKFVAFELEARDEKYFLVGQTTPDVESTLSFVRRLRQLVAPGNQVAAAENAVDLSFTAADIENLDEQERSKRARFNQIPDAQRISQVLRSVGGFLDGRGATGLLGIKFGEGLVTFRFHSADGHIEEQRQDLSSFYDYVVKMYLRRSIRRQNHSQEPTLYSQWDGESAQELDGSPRLLH